MPEFLTETAAMTPSHSTARPLGVRALALALSLVVALPAPAATALADQPLFSNANVPGNLSLPLSVEFPTAVSVAHVSDNYSSANVYQGYFDPDKCYLYQPVDVETATSKAHFAPAGSAAAHTCIDANAHKWSGNFMNWLSMQTIDPFRWALTGGYRVVDTPGLTILEKAWASGQGGAGNFPVRNVADATTIANATPFLGSGAWASQIAGLGESMVLTVDNAGLAGGMLGSYYNSVDLTGTPALTRSETVDFSWAGSPGAGVNADNFSVRWVSRSTAPSTGNYSFQTVTNGGLRLYVNGALVIDNWPVHGNTTNTSANVALTAGAALNIRLEFYDTSASAQMRLRWKKPGDAAYSVYSPGAYLSLPIRVRVCDPSAAAGGKESNCQPYANGNYKPEGLMQQYADRIRYSVFGYLNDSNIQRDGGVLRAKQKFVGPTQPVPGSSAIANAGNEWDATTGVYVTNPDAADADATAALFGTPISNSGVLNYLNKFGEINRSTYKSYDPVGELYYAALRYYKNLGNVAAWTSMAGADAATRATWADGFPVITNWGDPILYSCQRNFILGIGDVNSHADKNVPGNTGATNEPAKPAEVVADVTVNAVTATNKVGVMEGLGAALGTSENYNGCCNNNSALMAGLAYDANTTDIRPDLPNKAKTVGQTVQTFWLDVLEYQTYKPNNQFYLAAKYGGFKAPSDFDPYAANATLQDSWWHTTTDTVGSGGSSQPRPDNYFTSARPDQMIDGLRRAFASIADALKAYTTSFSTSLPQVSTSGNGSFSAQYDASNWSGEIVASTLSFAAGTGEPSEAENWRFGTTLEAQSAGAGWDTGRRIVTWKPTNATSGAGVAFRLASLGAGQQAALDTTYRAGGDAGDYLNYLRGERAQEQNSAVAGSSKAYRTRTKLLGDIVGSKTRPVGPPNLPLSNAANPGYSSFKTTWAGRQSVIYVGANDGMLHAINGSLVGAVAGSELFAYVPAALFNGPTTPAAATNASVDGLAALGNPSFTHHNYVNATPNVYDIDFAKTVGGSGAAAWRSVLIGGLGKGGKSYYAIDVTDPGAFDTEAHAAAKVLWEFSDADLGFSFGDPAVLKTKKYGWVVIFGSGYNNGGSGTFFIVNPRTGALLEKVSTGVGTAANDAGLAHVNAFVLDRTDGTADAAYAGDLLGNLWRLDLSAAAGAYPAPTRLASLTDGSGAVRPVTMRPRIAVDPSSNRRYVLVGSGRALDSSDIASTQVQGFYAIQDGTATRFNAAANLPAGVSFPILRANLVQNADPTAGVAMGPSSMGWYLELGQGGAGSVGWRVVSDASTYFGTVSFASTLPNGSACEPSGKSRIYSLEFESGQSVLIATTAGVNGAPPTTATIAYNDKLSGVVTDLSDLSVNGEHVLIGGTSEGDKGRIEQKSSSALALRRLNWRELPLAD